MPQDNELQFSVEGATLIYKNFEGKKDMYNTAGRRECSIVLDPVLGEQLLADGWNVKIKEPREEGEEGFYFLTFETRFEGFKPARIVLLTAKSKLPIDEDNVDMLDWADITDIDVTIRAYRWEMGDKSGWKAVLKTMYAKLLLDPTEAKYEALAASKQEAAI